jgi:hypothetical protein
VEDSESAIELSMYVTVTPPVLCASQLLWICTKLAPLLLPHSFLINLPKFISVSANMRINFATAAVLALGAQSVAASTWFSKAGKSRMLVVDSWLSIASSIECASEHALDDQWTPLQLLGSAIELCRGRLVCSEADKICSLQQVA